MKLKDFFMEIISDCWRIIFGVFHLYFIIYFFTSFIKTFLTSRPSYFHHKKPNPAIKFTEEISSIMSTLMRNSLKILMIETRYLKHFVIESNSLKHLKLKLIQKKKIIKMENLRIIQQYFNIKRSVKRWSFLIGFCLQTIYV